ncbi:PAP2 superfamily protein [Mumia flava]|uniref:PAP2 superfamily protein n=1 Tax=Mumia flava TaxID=1348852 RepID=A0A2M9BI75_9ACTN|nr:phosphatase PAP2 family protein [Mumia flava]PJJ57643.1 PAP2 superfamily protein [Mumia flava]
MASPTVARAPSAGHERSGGRTFAAALALLVTSVGILVADVVWMLQTPRGQQVDEAAMEAVYARAETLETLLGVLGYVSLASMVLVMAVLVAMALLRRRFAAALAAVGLVVAANVTTQILKHAVLDRPDYGYGWYVNSLPSGHTTAAASMVLAALLVSPRGLRWMVAAAGSAGIVLTGVSTIVAGWHRPADVVAALAVCLAWGAFAVAALAVRRGGSAGGSFLGTLVWSVTGAALAGVVLVLVGVRPDGGWSGFAPAAAVLALTGLASAVAVTVFERLSAVFAR